MRLCDVVLSLESRVPRRPSSLNLIGSGVHAFSIILLSSRRGLFSLAILRALRSRKIMHYAFFDFRLFPFIIIDSLICFVERRSAPFVARIVVKSGSVQNTGPVSPIVYKTRFWTIFLRFVVFNCINIVL
jgi:hypothetical protein